MTTFAPAMELGASFGAKYATVMGADTDWSRQRDNFIKTCDLAKQFGLTCSLEFAVIRPLATLPQTVQLITEAKRDAVICIDPLHLARSGGSAADVKALDAKYFPYAQISDGVLEPGEPNPGAVRQARASASARCPAKARCRCAKCSPHCRRTFR